MRTSFFQEFFFIIGILHILYCVENFSKIEVVHFYVTLILIVFYYI